MITNSTTADVTPKPRMTAITARCVWLWPDQIHSKAALAATESPPLAPGPQRQGTYRSCALLSGCSSKRGHMIDDWREIGWSVELYLRQAGPIRLYNALDS